MGKMVRYDGGDVSSEYNQIITLVLWWFAGVFGVHRFYVGKWLSGLAYLFTGGFFFLGWLWDGYQLLTGEFTDAKGHVVGPPRQKALPAPRHVPDEKRIEDDLQKLVDRDTPDVKRDEVERELERDPLEDKFDELERELGKK